MRSSQTFPFNDSMTFNEFCAPNDGNSYNFSPKSVDTTNTTNSLACILPKKVLSLQDIKEGQGTTYAQTIRHHNLPFVITGKWHQISTDSAFAIKNTLTGLAYCGHSSDGPFYYAEALTKISRCGCPICGSKDNKLAKISAHKWMCIDCIQGVSAVAQNKKNIDSNLRANQQNLFQSSAGETNGAILLVQARSKKDQMLKNVLAWKNEEFATLSDYASLNEKISALESELQQLSENIDVCVDAQTNFKLKELRDLQPLVIQHLSKCAAEHAKIEKQCTSARAEIARKKAASKDRTDNEKNDKTEQKTKCSQCNIQTIADDGICQICEQNNAFKQKIDVMQAEIQQNAQRLSTFEQTYLFNSEQTKSNLLSINERFDELKNQCVTTSNENRAQFDQIMVLLRAQAPANNAPANQSLRAMNCLQPQQMLPPGVQQQNSIIAGRINSLSAPPPLQAPPPPPIPPPPPSSSNPRKKQRSNYLNVCGNQLIVPQFPIELPQMDVAAQNFSMPAIVPSNNTNNRADDEMLCQNLRVCIVTTDEFDIADCDEPVSAARAINYYTQQPNSKQISITFVTVQHVANNINSSVKDPKLYLALCSTEIDKIWTQTPKHLLTFLLKHPFKAFDIGKFIDQCKAKMRIVPIDTTDILITNVFLPQTINSYFGQNPAHKHLLLAETSVAKGGRKEKAMFAWNLDASRVEVVTDGDVPANIQEHWLNNRQKSNYFRNLRKKFYKTADSASSARRNQKKKRRKVSKRDKVKNTESEPIVYDIDDAKIGSQPRRRSVRISKKMQQKERKQKTEKLMQQQWAKELIANVKNQTNCVRAMTVLKDYHASEMTIASFVDSFGIHCMNAFLGDHPAHDFHPTLNSILPHIIYQLDAKRPIDLEESAEANDDESIESEDKAKIDNILEMSDQEFDKRMVKVKGTRGTQKRMQQHMYLTMERMHAKGVFPKELYEKHKTHLMKKRSGNQQSDAKKKGEFAGLQAAGDNVAIDFMIILRDLTKTDAKFKEDWEKCCREACVGKSFAPRSGKRTDKPEPFFVNDDEEKEDEEEVQATIGGAALNLLEAQDLKYNFSNYANWTDELVRDWTQNAQYWKFPQNYSDKDQFFVLDLLSLLCEFWAKMAKIPQNDIASLNAEAALHANPVVDRLVADIECKLFWQFLCEQCNEAIAAPLWEFAELLQHRCLAKRREDIKKILKRPKWTAILNSLTDWNGEKDFEQYFENIQSYSGPLCAQFERYLEDTRKKSASLVYKGLHETEYAEILIPAEMLRDLSLKTSEAPNKCVHSHKIDALRANITAKELQIIIFSLERAGQINDYGDFIARFRPFEIEIIERFLKFYENELTESKMKAVLSILSHLDGTKECDSVKVVQIGQIEMEINELVLTAMFSKEAVKGKKLFEFDGDADDLKLLEKLFFVYTPYKTYDLDRLYGACKDKIQSVLAKFNINGPEFVETLEKYTFYWQNLTEIQKESTQNAENPSN